MRFVLISEDETTATAYDTRPNVNEDDDEDDRLVIEEGELGVWIGFSSADRDFVCGGLPIEPSEDFIGNGDPVFFLTAGVPSGVSVPATDSCDKDSTHPLYQAWLDAQE